MSDINVNNDYTKMNNLTPFKLCVLQNFPFIEADFDAVTNYQLLCKVVEYLNNVIDNNNKQNINITQLEQNFITLYNYVKDYFDNLDVQEEINNKLDEMAQSGQLDIIFDKYIPYITMDSCGAVGDGIADDTQALVKALNSNKNIIIGNVNKKYKVNSIIINKEIHFVNCNFYSDSFSTSSDMSFIIKCVNKSSFYNCSFESELNQKPLINILNGTDVGVASNIFGVWALSEVSIIDCTFKHIYGCDCRGTTYINNCIFSECEMGIYVNSDYVVNISNCDIECSRLVSSTYYHALYIYKAKNINCDNIIIKESAGTLTGNHLHFYNSNASSIETIANCNNITFQGDIISELVQNNNATLIINSMTYTGSVNGSISQSGRGITIFNNCNIKVTHNIFLNCRNSIEIYNSIINTDSVQLSNRCNLILRGTTINCTGELNMSQDTVVDNIEISDCKINTNTINSLNVGTNSTRNIISNCYYSVKEGPVKLLARGYFLNNIINEYDRNLSFSGNAEHNSVIAFFYQNNTYLKRVEENIF